uniref:N-acetyltransferase domain-containing protein n=1 Tax=Haemonchus contortus TaxID=6289 RepID=A0A7I4Z853_HAECO
MQQLREDDVEIIQYGTGEIWDQMRELVRVANWTTHDAATWQLFPERKNIYPIFAIRKSDNYLLGGVALVETDIALGAFYVMRPEIRGLGTGMKMMVHLLHLLHHELKDKAAIGRAVQAMYDKYSGPPFYAIHHHEMYRFMLPKEEILKMFPTTGSTLVPVSVKDMNPAQFEKVCAYDELVTGRNRREFLKEFYSIFFTNGVGLFDASGNVHGFIGAVPTVADSQVIKISPIFASNNNDVGYLLKCILEMIPKPDVKYAIHPTTNSAGDWMLQKCRDADIPLVFCGTAGNSTHNNIIYKDPCKVELMYAPMNSALFFDR